MSPHHSKKEENPKETNESNEVDFEFEGVSEDGGPEYAEKLKKLRDKLKETEREKAEYLLGWQRAKADAINREKEIAKEREVVRRFASENLILEILPVLDSFEMAKSNETAWNAVDPSWRKGIEHIFGQLYTTLAANGLKRFGAVGEKFDVTRHDGTEEEIVTEPDKDHIITRVLGSGYELGGKVIRGAKVCVGIYKKN